MDESNSFMDQSSYADPNKPVLRAILHTQQNKQFLEYVNGRQKASVKAAKILCCNSDGLKVLMEKFEQSVYNGTPLGQIKMMTHNLIGNGFLEVVELLQIPFNRPDSKVETGTATHLPPDRPPHDDVKQVLDFASDQEVSTNYESTDKHNTNLTMDLEKRVSVRTDYVIADVVVHEQFFEQNKRFSGVTEAEISQFSLGQDVTGGSESVDLMDNTFAPEVVQYQDQPIGMECETVGEDQDVTEDGVQIETTNASTSYDDLLTRSIKEFYRKVPWMYYIVSQVQARRRWKSMSDLDEFKKKEEKEAEQKAKVEAETKMAEEQRVLIAQRIEARAQFPLDYDMNWRIVNFFIVPLSNIKSSPPFTPALSKYLNYIKTSRAGGLRVDVRQYLSQRVKSNTDPEKSAFYKTLQKYANNPMISSFVLFMCNKWKTGKTLKSKENAFLKELNQWIDSVWSMERTKYLARRRRGIRSNWQQETSLQLGGGGSETRIKHQQLKQTEEKTKVANPKLTVDLDEYLKQLADNNREAYVFPSGCFQHYNALLIREYIEGFLEEIDVKFVVFAICYEQHWRILKIDSKAIHEYDALNLPIPPKVEAVITELRKSKSLGFRRLSEDPSKPKQRDGHNCGLFVIGQAIEWMSNKPWTATTLPSMPQFRMDVLEKLMATCLCTRNNSPVTISTVSAHRQELSMQEGSGNDAREQVHARPQLTMKEGPSEIAREQVVAKTNSINTSTKKGCEIDIGINDVSIMISAEDGNGISVKVRAGEQRTFPNANSEANYVFNQDSFEQKKFTSGYADTQPLSQRDVLFNPEAVDQLNITNAPEVAQYLLQTNEVCSQARKRTSSENSTPPAAKKPKEETIFVIHGFTQRSRPVDNGPFMEFLSDHGFATKNKSDILANVSLPTRLPKPRFLANFSVTGKTKEDLLHWLDKESTVVQFYSSNRKQFGTSARNYHLISKYEGIGYARVAQFMLHLMELCACQNTLDTFRLICSVDYNGIKAILLDTDQQDILQILESFSVHGRKDVQFAFKDLMNIDRSFWKSSKSAAKTGVMDVL